MSCAIWMRAILYLLHRMQGRYILFLLHSWSIAVQSLIPKVIHFPILSFSFSDVDFHVWRVPGCVASSGHSGNFYMPVIWTLAAVRQAPRLDVGIFHIGHCSLDWTGIRLVGFYWPLTTTYDFKSVLVNTHSTSVICFSSTICVQVLEKEKGVRVGRDDSKLRYIHVRYCKSWIESILKLHHPWNFLILWQQLTIWVVIISDVFCWLQARDAAHRKIVSLKRDQK